jgi:hypothetical protein
MQLKLRLLTWGWAPAAPKQQALLWGHQTLLVVPWVSLGAGYLHPFVHTCSRFMIAVGLKQRTTWAAGAAATQGVELRRGPAFTSRPSTAHQQVRVAAAVATKSGAGLGMPLMVMTVLLVLPMEAVIQTPAVMTAA